MSIKRFHNSELLAFQSLLAWLASMAVIIRNVWPRTGNLTRKGSLKRIQVLPSSSCTINAGQIPPFAVQWHFLPAWIRKHRVRKGKNKFESSFPAQNTNLAKVKKQVLHLLESRAWVDFTDSELVWYYPQLYKHYISMYLCIKLYIMLIEIKRENTIRLMFGWMCLYCLGCRF